jgi:serine protease AprX
VLNDKTLLFEAKPGLKTGQAFTTSVQVANGTARLRIALCYSDFPGAALVNDINLIVSAPNGRKRTNQGASGTLSTDNRNNVEVVHVRQPRAGAWRIDVVGGNVPQDPQDFALAVLGASG